MKVLTKNFKKQKNKAFFRQMINLIFQSFMFYNCLQYSFITFCCLNKTILFKVLTKLNIKFLINLQNFTNKKC